MASTPFAPRVYWLTEEFFPPQVGGAEFMASYLTAGLARNGFQVTVVTRQPESVCTSVEYIGSVCVRRIHPRGQLKGKGWYALFATFGFLMRLLSLLIRERREFDLVIVSGMKIIPLVAVPVCRIFNKLCVVRVESSFEILEPISAGSMRRLSGIFRRITSSLLERAQHYMARRTDCIVVISDEIERLLERAQIRTAIARIPNAVDLNRFKPVGAVEREELRRRLRIPLGATVVLFAGRLSRAKGIEMLIHAWPGLIAKHPDLFLVIVGSAGESFDRCELEIISFIKEHSLQQSTLLAGQSDHVEAYLQSADVFVFPSEYEGFSLALIEALGCAVPSVVSAVGAAPQLIEHGKNGFMFPPKESIAMVAALEMCLNQRGEWSAIGRRARETVGKYDLSVIIEAYLQLCARILRAKSAD
jgi:glycosyltransferase involved in cell wall biosynthesis